MKSIFPGLLACALAVSSFAQETKTTTAATNQPAQLVLTLPVSAAAITKPFVVTNGAVSQPDQMDVADGGKAIFEFALTNAGTYLIRGLVNAPDESINSFFINVDAMPDDSMIWDLELTNGFEERTVNWRGNGSSESGEFVPKKFKLAAGAHKLFLIGREPAQLKSLSILREGD